MIKSCRHRRLHATRYTQANDRDLFKSWKRSYMRTSNLQARREGEDEIVSFLLNMGSGYGYDTVHVEAEMKAGGTRYDTQLNYSYYQEDSYYPYFQTSFGDWDDDARRCSLLDLADEVVGDMVSVPLAEVYEPHRDQKWNVYMGIDCVGDIILDNEHLQWCVTVYGNGGTESLQFDYLEMSLAAALRLIKIYTAIVNNYRHEDVPF